MHKSTLLNSPGTYVLLLHCRRTINLRIGSWGRLTTSPGFYLYVGSAFGQGGLRARVARHCRRIKAKRWHIDYLRQFTTVDSIWYSCALEHLEHRWAKSFSEMKGLKEIPGFGCSDCSCAAHLFYSETAVSITTFAKAAGTDVELLSSPILRLRTNK